MCTLLSLKWKKSFLHSLLSFLMIFFNILFQPQNPTFKWKIACFLPLSAKPFKAINLEITVLFSTITSKFCVFYTFLFLFESVKIEIKVKQSRSVFAIFLFYSGWNSKRKNALRMYITKNCKDLNLFPFIIVSKKVAFVLMHSFFYSK